jgi:protein-S-isoprenylcysteine O-methyltransferase Ste14
VTHLALRAWFALAALAVVMGLLLFIPAGTLRYWQAWVYLGIFFGASALTTAFLIHRDPALLERRMRGGPTAEKRPVERLIMVFTSIGFIALLVVPALDYRFQWSNVPLWAVVRGDVLVIVGFYFIFLVYRENTFTSATIEVAPGQTVISTGPYAIVRHPMYASALLYLAGHSAGARFVLGIGPACGHDPLPDLAALRRGNASRGKAARLHRLSEQGEIPSRAGNLVTLFR